MNQYLKYGLVAVGGLLTLKILGKVLSGSGDMVSPTTTSTTTNNVTGISNGVTLPLRVAAGSTPGVRLAQPIMNPGTRNPATTPIPPYNGLPDIFWD